MGIARAFGQGHGREVNFDAILLHEILVGVPGDQQLETCEDQDSCVPKKKQPRRLETNHYGRTDQDSEVCT